jgi:hypothetical protein
MTCTLHKVSTCSFLFIWCIPTHFNTDEGRSKFVQKSATQPVARKTQEVDQHLTVNCSESLKLVICGDSVFILQTRPCHQMMSMWRLLCVRNQTYRKMSKFTFFNSKGIFEMNYKFNMLLSGGNMFLK